MPSGCRPSSSGLRRIKIKAGITTNTNVIRPKIDQVSRQPIQVNSAAVKTGIQTLANPWPMLATAMARPRLRTNQRDIVTLTIMWHMNTPPMATKIQRSKRNCQNAPTWLISTKPNPAESAPPAINQRPPKRSIIGPTSGAIAAPMRISPERKSENKPRETPKSSVSGFKNTLSVLDM